MLVIAPLLLTVVLAAQAGQAAAPASSTTVASSPWTDDRPAARNYEASVARWVAAVGDVLGGRSVQAGAAIAVWAAGIKAAANRVRPNGERYSFPSGHTSAAFTTATVFQQHCGWKGGPLAYAVAGFVAWSRVRSSHHWLSDVAMGSAIGILAVCSIPGITSTWTLC